MKKIKSKSKIFQYLSLLISTIIIIVIIILIFRYNNPVIKQRFNEDIIIDAYIPFNGNNKLAELDDASEFKLTDNLPILDGATAFYPIYAAFVQAVYPSNKDYGRLSNIVLCSRTAKAYNNLLEGKVDLIFCLEPSEIQLQQFRDNNINTKLVPIAREAFIFFIDKRNKIKNLSVEDIKGIYSGKVNNWNVLNGPNKRIRAYQRDINSGSQTILEKIMGDIPIVRAPSKNIRESMGNLIYEFETFINFSNAIGYSFFIYSTEMVKTKIIKIISINGIYPSMETIQNNSYPFTENIYAIYNDTENKNENIEPFIEWILSRQGQELIFKTGYTPVN